MWTCLPAWLCGCGCQVLGISELDPSRGHFRFTTVGYNSVAADIGAEQEEGEEGEEEEHGEEEEGEGRGEEGDGGGAVADEEGAAAAVATAG